MHGRLRDVRGVLGADDDVAQLTRAGDAAGLVDGKRQHVGRLVASAVLAVQLTDPAFGDQLHGEMSLPHPRRPQGRGRRGAQRLGHISEVGCRVGGQSDALSERSYSPYAATIRCTSSCRTTSVAPNRTNEMSATWSRISPMTT